jgi:hypothetical protein
MATPKLGIFDLLAPQFLAGIVFDTQVAQYLGIFKIDKYHAFYTDREVVFTGTGSFVDDSGSQTVSHNQSEGNSFSWDAQKVAFRMIIPRNGATLIHQVLEDSSETDILDQKIAALKPLFDDLKNTGTTTTNLDDPNYISDYPGLSFKLELLVDALNFTLGSDWIPGVYNKNDRKVVPSKEQAGKRIQLKLPKVLISYSQTDDDATTLKPEFKLENWGVAGFDAARDLAAGELVRMEPAIALHESGHVAFSVEQVILDLSESYTPPEIMQHFGVDEKWTGLFVKKLLFYYMNDVGVGLCLQVNDALIGFNGEVSFEAALDFHFNKELTRFKVTPVFFLGDKQLNGLILGNPEDFARQPPSTDPTGSITIPQNAIFQLRISGGYPPYEIVVKVVEEDGTTTDWAANQYRFENLGTKKLFIAVKDADIVGRNNQNSWAYFIAVTVVAPEVEVDEDAPLAELEVAPLPHSHPSHRFIVENQDQSEVLVKVQGPEPFELVVNEGGEARKFTNLREIRVPVGNEETKEIHLEFDDGTEQTNTYDLNFRYNRPLRFTDIQQYVNGDFTPENFDNLFLPGRNQLLNELPPLGHLEEIVIEGWASLESEASIRNTEVSEWRKEVAVRLLKRHYGDTVSLTSDHFGDGTRVGRDPHFPNTSFDPNNRDYSNGDNRIARIVVRHKNPGTPPLKLTLKRGAAPEPPPPISPDPHPMPNDIPTVFKQLGIRTRIEKNRLSLLELYGKIDIETALEKELRTSEGRQIDRPSGSDYKFLENGNDGLIDFILQYQFDRATKETKLSLTVKADDRDQDGLLHMNNPGRGDVAKNILGALLIFAPIINKSIESVGKKADDGANWLLLGASLAAPVAIAGTGFLTTRKIMLHGIELRSKFVVPNEGEPLRSLDIGLMFDYEVHFDIVCTPLGIGVDRASTVSDDALPKPLRARYKALGFNIGYKKVGDERQMEYKAIFDASKGYDLDLSDPSLFSLPAPLNELFNIAAARLARQNPLTLELDFVIKMDLGLITVDKFKLKIPLYNDGQPIPPPQIIPSGVRVNIPGVIIGNGFVNIVDTEVDGVRVKGIEGGLDVTLVAMKLRVAAHVGISKIKEQATNREAVAIFLGLRVEFPAPIILGATGLGIYGFMGLFAMHYKRLESDRVPGSPVGPALAWLIKADGDPTKIRNNANQPMWGAALDRWSFGIGIIMGTVEGGFLVNLQGMFVLELPGPRILIMVKAQLVSILPSNPATPATTLQTGIIGIIDLDFGRGTITLGVMINFKVEKLLDVAIPIELYFEMNNPSRWHLHLGTISHPASAEILGIVKGSAYVMLQGYELKYSDYNRVPAFFQNKRLPGIAIAMGLEASITLGNVKAKIYLKIAAGAHLGVSFKPIYIIGNMFFEGKLRLVVVSIGANGNFDVLVTRTSSNALNTYIQGKVCGKVNLFFFKLEACVGLTIGSESTDPIVPPSLMRGVYLQSFAPVLVSGQGSTNKPIDASLGNAVKVENGRPVLPEDQIPVVPIDTLPVLQFSHSPEVAGSFDADSDFEIIGSNPGPNGGFLILSDELKIKYTLKSVVLREVNGPRYAASGPDKPDAVWRRERPANVGGSDQNIDLALFSRAPVAAEYAMERSTNLQENVLARWGNLCKKPAPPAPALFTFCGKPLGASSDGWKLNGTPLPDPEGTLRVQQPTYQMTIRNDRGFSQSPLEDILGVLGMEQCNPASIVGVDHLNIQIPEASETRCIQMTAKKRGFHPNPLIVEDQIQIFSSVDRRSFYDRKTGFLQFETLEPFNSPYRTQYRSIQNFIAFSLREYVRIDILGDRAVSVTLRFTSIRQKAKDAPRFVAAAYNSQSKRVDAALTRQYGKITDIYELTLRGEDIKYILLYNRNYTGQLVEICIEKKQQNPGLQNFVQLQSMLPCFRALQLPYCYRPINQNEKPQKGSDTHAQPNYSAAFMERFGNLLEYPEFVNFLNREDACCSLDFELGPFAKIGFMGAMRGRASQPVLVHELDSSGQVLHTHNLADLRVRQILNPMDDLPDSWLDDQLPWRASVLPVTVFLMGGMFNGFERNYYELIPENSKTTAIRICTCDRIWNGPIFYLSAMEVLPQSEVLHHAEVTAFQETEMETLTRYITTDAPAMLLKPNRQYDLVVQYETEIHTRKSHQEHWNIGAPTAQSETFRFKTDEQPPDSGIPYLMSSTPSMDAPYHFYKDSIFMTFNDKSFIRMMEAYGKSLAFVIYAADGQPIESQSVVEGNSVELNGIIGAPYREAILAAIEAGELSCVPGQAILKSHTSFKLDFPLQPRMPYVLDLQVQPGGPAQEAETPFLRKTFKTSRYADLEAFAAAVVRTPHKHLALEAPLPAAAHDILPDDQFEQLLEQAGPIEAAAEHDLRLFWAPILSGEFRPHALLLNTCEPMWRQVEALKAVHPNPAAGEEVDPNFYVYEPGMVEAIRLEVAEAAKEMVLRVVRNQAGNKTLLILNPDFDWRHTRHTLEVEIVQDASTLPGNVDKTCTLLEVPLSPLPPWEGE